MFTFGSPGPPTVESVPSEWASRWGWRGSNPHWGRFKRPASADWATPPRHSGHQVAPPLEAGILSRPPLATPRPSTARRSTGRRPGTSPETPDSGRKRPAQGLNRARADHIPSSHPFSRSHAVATVAKVACVTGGRARVNRSAAVPAISGGGHGPGVRGPGRHGISGGVAGHIVRRVRDRLASTLFRWRESRPRWRRSRPRSPSNSSRWRRSPNSSTNRRSISNRSRRDFTQ